MQALETLEPYFRWVKALIEYCQLRRLGHERGCLSQFLELDHVHKYCNRRFDRYLYGQDNCFGTVEATPKRKDASEVLGD
jgi:hypothetical protein